MATYRPLSVPNCMSKACLSNGCKNYNFRQLIAALLELKETLTQPNKDVASDLLLGAHLAQFVSLPAHASHALSTHARQSTAQTWQPDKVILEIANNARLRRLQVALNILALI